MKRTILLMITSLLLIGCGSNETKDSAIDKTSKKYFGMLSNATVNIYELGGAKKLLFSEKTSTGKMMDDIGNFNDYSNSFDSKKFYLYEVSGGENWDIDKDAKLDKIPTTNDKFYRSIYKGSRSHVAWWSSTTTS